MDPPPTCVELHLAVPLEDGEFASDLWEDDGLTTARDRGAFVHTHLQVRRSGRRLDVTAVVSGEGYPEFVRERFRLLVRGGDISGARLDGRPLLPTAGAVEFPNGGTGFELELTLA
jgi:alpha-glucosidase